MAWATGASDRPASRRNGGRVWARTSSSYPASPSSSARRPAAAPPSGPVTTRTSPARAPARPGTRSLRPTAVTVRWTWSAAVVSPPRTGTPVSASPSYSSRTEPTSVSGRTPRETKSASGSAPAAARSLRLTAAALKPRSCQVVHSSRKWTASTSMSWVTTTPPSRTAVSSPMLSASPRRVSSARRPSSPRSESLDPKDVHRPVADAEVAEADPSPAVRARARDREKAWYHGTARLPSAR